MDHQPSIPVRGLPRRPTRLHTAWSGCLEPATGGRTVSSTISDIGIVVFVLTVMALRADSQCSQLVVSEANYQDAIDGSYILYKTCNGQWSWIQMSADNEPSNFIYAGCSNCQNNGSWYIGRHLIGNGYET